jgi:large repetitive protein
MKRTTTAPDGVVTHLELNRYGNVKTATVGAEVTQMTWGSDTVGGMVFPTKVSNLRELTANPTDRLIQQETRLGTAEGKDIANFANPLESRTIDDRYGVPSSTTTPTGTFASQLNGKGDVTGGNISGGGTTVSFTRGVDDDGVETTGTDVAGATVTFSGSNGFGQPTSATSTLAGATGLVSVTRTFSYDSLGRQTGVSDSTGAATTSSYDSVGRLRTRTVAGSPSETWGFDYQPSENGYTVVETLAETGLTRTKVYADRLLQSETVTYGRGKSATRTYHYTAGRLTSFEDEDAKTHTLSYDNAGRVLSETVGSQAITYTRDGEGKILTVTDQNGHVTSIGYDKLGRPVRWDYGDGDVDEVSRDAAGAITEISYGVPPTHVVTIQRDALGNPRVTQSAAANGGVNQTIWYDRSGRKQHLDDAVAELDETYEYNDVLGRLTRRVRTIATATGPSTSTETRTYDDTARTITVERVVDTRTERETLTTDVRGRIMSVQRAGEDAVTFTYDALGGVRTVSGPVAIVRNFDEQGRLLDETRGGVKTEYTHDALGRVKTQAGPHPSEQWTFGYDAFGQVLSKQLAAAGTTPAASRGYTYTGGQVIEVGPKATTTTTVNARGRVKRTEVVGDDGTLTTDFTYDGPFPKSEIQEESGSRLAVAVTHDDRGRELTRSEIWSGGGESYDYQRSTPWTGRTAAVEETWRAPESARRAGPGRSRWTASATSCARRSGRPTAGPTTRRACSSARRPPARCRSPTPSTRSAAGCGSVCRGARPPASPDSTGSGDSRP